MALEVKHLLLPSPIDSYEQTLKLKPSWHPPLGHPLSGYPPLGHPPDHGSRISDHGFWITDFGSRISDHGFRITDFGSQISDHNFWITDFGSRISDGDSLGICWGRFTGALSFMSIIFHYVLLISILICTFDGCKIRIKGLRDCLDL